MTARPLIAAAMLAATTAVAAGPLGQPAIAVYESEGVYGVTATFTVEAPAEVVRAVLTDYENIPRFMPDVRSSRVLDRENEFVRVEQFATAKYLMFSRDIHLVLMVEEGPSTLRFGDIAGSSFRRYEGAWMLARVAEGTEVAYALAARPAFSVPGFVLRRLLDRDARVMIDRLRSEIATRARR